eukprot:Polyplicarium_translucidae@DN3320_c3_g1_i11.p1
MSRTSSTVMHFGSSTSARKSSRDRIGDRLERVPERAGTDPSGGSNGDTAAHECTFAQQSALTSHKRTYSESFKSNGALTVPVISGCCCCCLSALSRVRSSTPHI